MRPGDRHHLLLHRERAQPSRSSRQEIVDPFDSDLPRYAAQSTNRAPWPPRMIITVTGNGTNHRITFDKRQVTVGSSPAADVFLDDEAISPTHLRLIAHNKTVVVHGRSTTIDGKLLRKPTAVNYRSHVVLGPYLLNIVLLTKPWFPSK